MDDTDSRTAPAPRSEPARDGRDARWEGHRAERRTALVDATIRAIRTRGATVGMDDIAAEAGTSKTVVYRHFEDRAGLYRAVAERIEQRVVGDIGTALARSTSSGHDPRHLIASTIDAYLALVESDTELYRFVVNRPLVDRPLTDDPVEGTVSRVTDLLTRLLEDSVRDSGIPGSGIRVWAIALVGSVQAVADDWLASSDRLPRAVLVETLTEIAWHGVSPVFAGATARVAPAQDVAGRS